MSAQKIMEISPIVPVVAIDNADDAIGLAEALLEGGIGVMEITLRTKSALKSIEKVAENCPQMRVGAGTVVNFEGFKNANEHGSQFVFSPGISAELINASQNFNIPFIPGVATASDIMMALNHNLFYCKLFPATVVGGIEALKAFYGPFNQMRFCPTGGVGLHNVKEFLDLPNVLCVGGSWIVPKEAILNKDFKQITRLCKEAMDIIKN